LVNHLHFFTTNKKYKNFYLKQKMTTPSWTEGFVDSLKRSIVGGRVDRKPYPSKYAKQRPIVRQVIRNAFPGLSSVQAGEMVEFAGPHLAASLAAKLGENPTQSDVISAVRDLAQNPNAKTLLTEYKTSLETEMGAPLSRYRQGENEFLNAQAGPAQQNTAALKLRSRYMLPGAETLTETVDESVSDIVQSDLFSYNTANPENGVNNSVYIETELNAIENLKGANIPRPPDRLEQLVGLSDIPYQWHDTQNVDDEMSDIMYSAVVQSGILAMPPISVALKDRMALSDPFGLPRQANPFVPVNTLQPGFEVDYTQSTEFGELDRIGFKRADCDTLRFPRESSQFLPGDRPIAVTTSINMQRDDGIMVPMAFGSTPAPMGGTTKLHGQGFLPKSLFV